MSARPSSRARKPKDDPDRKSPARKPKRPPLGSRLTAGQYAILLGLVGGSLALSNAFYAACRNHFAECQIDEFSADDLIHQALERLFYGKLPKRLKFPKNRAALIEAVKYLGELHVANAKRKQCRRGPRSISLDHGFPDGLYSHAVSTDSTFLAAMQLDILRQLEERLLTRIAQIEFSKEPPDVHSASPTAEIEVELL